MFQVFQARHLKHPNAGSQQSGKAETDGSAITYYASGFVKAETRTSAGKILERKIWADGEHRELNETSRLDASLK